MSEGDRLADGCAQLDSKTRRLLVSFVEALVDANELIPTGHGTSDGIGSKGFESRVPGDTHLFAAQIVREAKQAIRGTVRDAAKLRAMIHHTKPATFANPGSKKPGRPSVITRELVHRVTVLRGIGYGPTIVVAKVSAEFGVSESTLWKAKERGTNAAKGEIERLLADALAVQTKDCKRRAKR